MRTRIQQKVYEIFDLNEKHISPKGWVTTKKACLWCGKDNYHFGIKFTKRTTRHRSDVSFHCFKCETRGGDFLLFQKLDMLTFLRQGEYIKRDDVLEKKINTIELPDTPLEIEVQTKRPPLGFRRETSDPYLDQRGFEKWQYESYTIGRSRFSSRLKDYVVFLILEDKENKGYVARITWSAERISSHEKSTKRKVPRYINEAGVDFGKLLFGIDEIDDYVQEVILVEGVTDKANVDRLLSRLGSLYKVKCLCTFGKKISDEQIEKLYRKNVDRVVFLYDPDAVEASKQYSVRMRHRFKEIRVGFLKNKDPGDLSLSEFNAVMESLEDPINFSVNKVQKRNLCAHLVNTGFLLVAKKRFA